MTRPLFVWSTAATLGYRLLSSIRYRWIPECNLSRTWPVSRWRVAVRLDGLLLDLPAGNGNS